MRLDANLELREPERGQGRPAKRDVYRRPLTPRKAVLLVAGDKSGGSERRFYHELIRKADERFDAHLARLGRISRPPQAGWASTTIQVSGKNRSIHTRKSENEAMDSTSFGFDKR
jgi:hypothetical protein